MTRIAAKLAAVAAAAALTIVGLGTQANAATRLVHINNDCRTVNPQEFTRLNLGSGIGSLQRFDWGFAPVCAVR